MIDKIIHQAKCQLRTLTLCGLALFLMSCTIQQPAPTPAAKPTSVATAVATETEASSEEASSEEASSEEASAGSYQPIETETCDALQSEVATALGVEVLRTDDAPFQAMLDGAAGESCQLTATGTGEDFTNFVDVASQLVGLLEAEDWVQDPQYTADGPTGTLLGLRRTANETADALAVVQVDWEPAPDVECPQDQPISECAETLEPAQMLYTIKIDLVQVAN